MGWVGAAKTATARIGNLIQRTDHAKYHTICKLYLTLDTSELSLLSIKNNTSTPSRSRFIYPRLYIFFFKQDISPHYGCRYDLFSRLHLRMYINTDLVAASTVTDGRMDEGCWHEARRADKVSGLLLLLRTKNELDDHYDRMTILLRDVELSSRLLRDLYDLFAIYRSRIPYIYYYLNVILPSMSKTMRDMMTYIDNDELPTRSQWTLMGERWPDVTEMGLSNRFQMYCEALVQIIRLLSRYEAQHFLFFIFSNPSMHELSWPLIGPTDDVSRSPLYDPTSLEDLRARMCRVRKLQGIPGTTTRTLPLQWEETEEE